jgi:hypothetical protein
MQKLLLDDNLGAYERTTTVDNWWEMVGTVKEMQAMIDVYRS